MDEATMTRSLEALTPPDLDTARERARAAARIRFGAGGAPSGAVLRRRPTLRVALAIALLAIAATALTPAGQAAVSWLGEQVGIGDPGGPPTLETLRRGWQKGTAGEGAPAYVLAAGPGPNGGHFELVTYEQKPEEARCFELDMTRERNSFTIGCGRLPVSGGIQVTSGGNSDPDQAFRFVAGRVSPDVASVRAELEGEPVDVETASIPAPLLRRLGIPPFRFFIGFPEDWRGGGRLDLTAENASGEELARRSLEIPGPLMP